MPSWIASLVGVLAPTLIKWGLNLLETQYPGIAPIINTIIGFISGSASPAAATQAMAAHVDTLVKPLAPVKA